MSEWPYLTPGIPDQEFIRGNIPMTKEEIRVVTISKLRLKGDSIVYDIGAGTGSLTVESALIAREGRVYAVEREEEGIELIDENIDKFTLDNVEVIKGQAPAVLAELPPVDRVIIGGSGGKLPEILDTITDKLRPEGRVIINAVTINTLVTAFEVLQELGYRLDICNLTVARTREAGNYQMLNGLNPVYIISGEKVD